MFTEDPKELAKQAKREEEERKRREVALLFILSTEVGRSFLWTLLADKCGVFSPSFYQDGKDSLTFWEEGKRHVGVLLMQEIQAASPILYAQMITERMDYLAKLSLNTEKLEDQPTHVTVETEDEDA